MIAKGLTYLVKPFALKQCGDPINDPIDRRGDGAINDHRSGYGERWERRRWRMKRPERVAAVGEGRRRTVAKDIRRAPQQENIFAPTPRIYPSAAVNIGRSIFVELAPVLPNHIDFSR